MDSDASGVETRKGYLRRGLRSCGGPTSRSSWPAWPRSPCCTTLSDARLFPEVLEDSGARNNYREGGEGPGALVIPSTRIPCILLANFAHGTQPERAASITTTPRKMATADQHPDARYRVDGALGDWPQAPSFLVPSASHQRVDAV